MEKFRPIAYDSLRHSATSIAGRPYIVSFYEHQEFF